MIPSSGSSRVPPAANRDRSIVRRTTAGMSEETLLAAAVKTDGGWVGLARTEKGIRRSTLPQKTKSEALRQLGEGWEPVDSADDPLLQEAANLIRDHFSGKPVSFNLPLDLSGLPDFTRRVLMACHRIPHGSTRSYAELAREVGNPKAARAVGQAMRRNPIPLIIPCHRVIGSDGSLIGFAGGQQWLPLKEGLLAHERPPEE